METQHATDDFLNYVFPGSSGSTQGFREQVAQLNRYCRLYKGAITSVLLTGEPGVGKTFAARAISAHSQWMILSDEDRRSLLDERGASFLFQPEQLIGMLLRKEHIPKRDAEIRCVPRLATVLAPQLADELAASELFGHMKGAFTGANKNHPGIFGDDAVEDILLDEIADLTPRIQAKLLQFIETRSFRPVGGMAKDEKTSQHRIFLATNRDLTRLVAEGSFREDFYHRVQGHTIHIPPLRDRREVITDLAFSILRSVNFRHRGQEVARKALPEELSMDRYCLLPESEWEDGRPTRSNWVRRLTDDDLRWCQEYNWPGNIRELRQRLEKYVFYNGHMRLKDVMSPDVFPDHALSRSTGTEMDDGATIDRLVSRYLERVLDGIEPAPRSPDELLRRFAGLTRDAVYRFKTMKRLGGKELRQVFPEAKDPETTIGRWRPLHLSSTSAAENELSDAPQTLTGDEDA